MIVLTDELAKNVNDLKEQVESIKETDPQNSAGAVKKEIKKLRRQPPRVEFLKEFPDYGALIVLDRLIFQENGGELKSQLWDDGYYPAWEEIFEVCNIYHEGPEDHVLKMVEQIKQEDEKLLQKIVFLAYCYQKNAETI
jgi:hypothetical protein